MRHGAIVSIASNRTLYALHEDGYVKVENYEKDAEEWENIIQISSVFNSANVALKSDGTMVASDMASILNPDNEDHWLAGISEWKNIVQFDYSYDRYGFGGIDAGLIIGVQADGELCYVSQKALSAESQAALKNFHDVKEISVFPGYNDLSADGMKLNIVAVTSDNKILKYSDSSFSEYESDDVIEVLGDGYYTEEGVKIVTLLKDGRLVALGSSISLVEDVVHLCKEGFAITRSGSVYALSDQVYDVNAKTTVFDEWVERIN